MSVRYLAVCTALAGSVVRITTKTLLSGTQINCVELKPSSAAQVGGLTDETAQRYSAAICLPI
jgi:hypothetical protein